MNAVMQVLLHTVPFHSFLIGLSKRMGLIQGQETPMLDAMLEFVGMFSEGEQDVLRGIIQAHQIPHFHAKMSTMRPDPAPPPFSKEHKKTHRK